MALALAPADALAQEQIKPYFLLIFDTSTSMAQDSNNDNVGETNAASRMYQAKSAVANIVNSTGDAAFGLERFLQNCTPSTNGCSCTGASQNNNCGARNGGEVLLGISEDNQPLLIEWVDRDAPGDIAVCDYDQNLYELRANGYTPLEGSLSNALTYFQSGVLNAWSQDYLGANVAWPSPIVQDQNRVPRVDACRPYAVILLTDGNETCGGTPGDASALLRSTTVNGTAYDVRTWVIGFGVAGPDADLEAIARAGGTDNPGDGLGAGTLEAFYPQDEVDLALALSQIIQDSLLVEECNGVDDDCDGLIDEGVTNACGGCGALTEACNGSDDDCDGLIDEGFPRYCDRPAGHFAQDLCADPGEHVCDLADDDCNGLIDEGNICNGCVPSPEVCDNLDNDCDGAVDDGVTRACGTDLGECTAGVEACVAGAWGPCNGRGSVAETCNGLDDDCNGVIDGLLQDCGTDEGACQAGRQRCDAALWGDCIGEVPPELEICDGVDNDCDGATDENVPGLGAGCGTDVGDCTSGLTVCSNGELTCSGQGPTPEVCDDHDNDCNGLVDDGNPEGGGPCGLSDEGDCSDGVLQCTNGILDCVGWEGPSPEVCDGRDNDCDTLIDEDNPGGGAPCGSDEGDCQAGVEACIGGAIVCDGEIPPAEEICDLHDNDCDGAIDEGLPVGEPCGTDLGECVPGIFRCTNGVPACEGEVPPTEEVCDGLDNDCDGAIDEDLPVGDVCGQEEGMCELGHYQCVDGDMHCAGGVPLQEERCDCQDNDCDGAVDEDPATLCPPGSTCLDCSCALPCGADLEFPCPPDRECVEGFCVSNPCAGVFCEAGTRCLGGECVSLCQGIDCEDGLRCREGRCEVDDCFHFPEDCTDQQACIRGECGPHPCEGVTCGDGQYCRDGDCVATCVDVPCASGLHCVDGACVDDPCAGIVCANEGSVCDPAIGSCAPDGCAGRECPLGTVCESPAGACVDDPCNVTRCPEGLVCDRGACERPGHPPAPVPARRILATGSGGCDCGVASSAPGAPGGVGLALVVLGLLLLRRRRVGVAAALAALLGAGCDVDPYCVNCPAPTGEDASTDAGWIHYDGGPTDDGGPGDGGSDPDGCVPGAAELCNGADEDCDGEIDEGIDFGSPAHCGTCDNVCTLQHTFPRCDDGVCGIDHCDVGYLDLDDDPTNGCEYACLATRQDDTDCNGLDDDCDGDIDEDVNGLSDPDNCGVGADGSPLCGTRCRPLHGVGSCTDGACVVDDCDDGFWDADHLADTGCEYRCEPDGDETCDARDNDCNGLIDDGNPGGGEVCGTDTGACATGQLTCELGRYLCEGGVEPVTEVCDGEDNDCDGELDESDPTLDGVCGSDEGECVAGRWACVDHVMVCQGAVAPGDEACDGRDNDCDGAIDDGNPGGGAACGLDVGACTPGAIRCVGGQLVCRDEVGPSIEQCNSTDDDCDGLVDEDFDLAADLDNCGACGIVCGFANAFPICDAGACDILACESGFVDRNQLIADGCEVACDFLGVEVCNGLDDDCDGVADDGVVAPVGVCNANGACAGAVASCGGAGGWTCQYGAAVQQDAQGNIAPETWCDGLDNDCDGLIDEMAPLKGTVCGNGVGACRREGTWVCDAANILGPVVCNAPAAGAPGVESCNGVDDDCDGVEDDGLVDDMVRVPGVNLWIYRYEASRSDATDVDPGVHTGRPCSVPDVLPWTDATWEEADDACIAAGKRLCTEAEWRDACEAVTNNCDWSYDNTAGFACQPGPAAYNPTTCNGNEYDFDPAVAGDQDGMLTTGFLPECGSDQLAGNGLELVYDLSGNAKEWTATDPAGGGVEYRIMGGAYNNPAGGLRCDFAFTVGEPSFHFPNVGFRCCSDVAP